MFDLELEISRWRRRMDAGGIKDPTVLRELESHLREHVERQVQAGADAHQAFESGVQRLGDTKALQREFARAEGFLNFSLLARLRRSWAVAGISFLAGLGVFAWHARVPDLYRGTTTVELQGLGRSATGNDIRAAERMNTAVQLLTSDRLRLKVAASLTPDEQKRLAKAAARALIVAAPVSDKFETGRVDQRRTVREQPTPPLGQLMVVIQRRSFMVRVSVDHPDPDAAALVSNRYIVVWQEEFAHSQNLSDASVRVIDAATAPRRPISPNYRVIAVLAFATTLGTFFGLTLLVLVIGNLTRPRFDREQLATS